jgi:hypothetical protein
MTLTDGFQSETVHKLISIPTDDVEIQVIATENTRIPARSQVTMAAKLSDDVQNGKVGYFKPKVDENMPMTAHAVTIVHDNTINLRIINPSNEDITVYCGMILGSLEDLMMKALLMMIMIKYTVNIDTEKMIDEKRVTLTPDNDVKNAQLKERLQTNNSLIALTPVTTILIKDSRHVSKTYY